MDIYSITITSYRIIDKSFNQTRLITPNGKFNVLKCSEILMDEFKEGDYLFI